MTDLAPYADAEQLLVTALAGFGRTGTVLPDDLRDLPLFVRVRRLGGTDDRVTDQARIAVEVFAPTRAAAWETARLVQQRLISGPTRVPGAGVIDRVRTEVGPQDLPYEDPRIRCVSATYLVSARRPA
ncbi:phage tail termination protein [Spirillospora sp. NBC_01491]|uniref:phage tail termination protein n=1 Tax=Spirillospora sp. NBC_01491 TaxID=2976007 RepID=UPI002E35F70B|nr:hypothetical protein [Spirillospora sp. NBC_01491]